MHLQLAEAIAERCVLGSCNVGRGLLYLGDFFLLTGVVEGLKRLPSIYRLHRKLLKLLKKLLDGVNALERAQVLGVDIDVIPMKVLLKRAAKSMPKVAKDAIEADSEA